MLTVDDREDIQSIVEEAKQKQYRLKDIVRQPSLSDLMKKPVRK